jgi:hypothetical protein
MQPVDLLCDVGHVRSCFGPFRDIVSVGADRCTVCIKRTMGAEIILNTPNGTTR